MVRNNKGIEGEKKGSTRFFYTECLRFWGSSRLQIAMPTMPRPPYTILRQLASPRVFEFVEVVSEHRLLPVVVHEGVSLSDAVELLKTPREQLPNKNRSRIQQKNIRPVESARFKSPNQLIVGLIVINSRETKVLTTCWASILKAGLIALSVVQSGYIFSFFGRGRADMACSARLT